MLFPLPPRAISAAEGISFCGGALLLAAPVVFDAREGEGAVVVGSVEAVLGDDCDAGFRVSDGERWMSRRTPSRIDKSPCTGVRSSCCTD